MDYRKPWIGANYEKQRLLIVGESHYWSNVEERDDPMMTINTLNDVISGRVHLSFFRKIEAAFKGIAERDVGVSNFWKTVAFINFYQGATDSAQGAKTLDMRNAGIRAFPKILEKLRPSHILVCSSAVWHECFNQFETFRWESYGNFRNGRNYEQGYLVDNQDPRIRYFCTWIPHPAARGWGPPSRWTPQINDFLSKGCALPTSRHRWRFWRQFFHRTNAA
jgi:hypothetical protein